MKLKLCNEFIAVENFIPTTSGTFLALPEADHCMGKISMVGESYTGPLIPGMTVFYGDQRTVIKMAGKEYQIMKSENIIALVENE